MDEDSSLLVDAEDLAIYRWRNVLLRFGPRAPDVEQVELFHSTLEDMLESHKRVGLLAWLPREAQLPDRPTRARASKMLRSLTPRLAGLAVVVDSPGVWASAVHRIINGLTVFAPVAVKITTRSDDASMWLSDRLKLGHDVGQALADFSRTRTTRINGVAS
ncbi:MAG: hypothetical protein JKY37_29910 [Nannocystaceae bacterium]|nr:hypothetical protein [Nannocystaceae bacterium]